MLAHADILVAYLRARFAGDDRGSGVLEYGLLLALIAMVCVVAVTFLGDRPVALSGSSGG